MNRGHLRVWLIVSTFWLFAISLYAEKTKEYKIVLASYPQFESAKKALKEMEGKLRKDDFALQNRYGFEFVARSAGKAFIIGIEPIGEKEAADTVLQHFRPLYPDAYKDKYYGVTAGTVFMDHPASRNTLSRQETAQDKAAGTVDRTVSETGNQEADSGAKETDHPHTEGKENTDGLLPYGTVFLTLILLSAAVTAGYAMRRFRQTRKRHTVHSDAAEDEPAVQSDAASEDESEREDEEIPVFSGDSSAAFGGDVSAAVPDAFYRLSKNPFFRTLIGELTTAARNKEFQRCRDLMDEVMRYQKNVDTSAVLTKMNELTDQKAFDKLVELIVRETLRED